VPDNFKHVNMHAHVFTCTCAVFLPKFTSGRNFPSLALGSRLANSTSHANLPRLWLCRDPPGPAVALVRCRWQLWLQNNKLNRLAGPRAQWVCARKTPPPTAYFSLRNVLLMIVFFKSDLPYRLLLGAERATHVTWCVRTGQLCCGCSSHQAPSCPMCI